MKIKNSTIDIIAFSSSLVCALHCAALPVLLSISYFGGLRFLGAPYIEWIFIGFGLLFVLISLVPSYRKAHRNAKPLQFAACGFVGIALARLNLTPLWEIVHMVVGASLVSWAHFLNWKFLRMKVNHKH